jgi:hypothetical protein
MNVDQLVAERRQASGRPVVLLHRHAILADRRCPDQDPLPAERAARAMAPGAVVGARPAM